jgi:hypothetical protein
MAYPALLTGGADQGSKKQDELVASIVVPTVSTVSRLLAGLGLPTCFLLFRRFSWRNSLRPLVQSSQW